MLGSKKINIIILCITFIVCVLAVVLLAFPQLFTGIVREGSENTYPQKIFGDDVLNIDIEVDEDEWDEMIENKMSKPYISCNMTVNGKKYTDVGIRPKGNASLTGAVGDRVSFRVDFDHYIKNQTCYGLEKMVLNNTNADPTYMKDYIVYDLMQYEGVNAPLHTFANITRNGEEFGLYIAAELYDEDYVERVYGAGYDAHLYNVKGSGLDAYVKATVDPETGTVISVEGIDDDSSSEGGDGQPPQMGGQPPQMGGQPPQMGGQAPQMGGQAPQMGGQAPQMGGQQPQNTEQQSQNGGQQLQTGGQAPQMGGQQPQNTEQQPQTDGQAPQMGGQQPQGMNTPPGGGGGPGGGSGGDLVYTDNSTESYKSIFANTVFDYTKADDYARIIRAIYYLNKDGVTKEEIEKYWNVDEILRYLAVHTYVVNGDSYISNMCQNYYLFEKDGVVSVLPWDYNLSFGTFSQGGGGPMGENAPPGQENTDGGKDSGKSTDKATEAVNFPIDTPVQGVDMEERPLISTLLAIDEYKELYHTYLKEVAQYAEGDFISKLNEKEKEIYPYILKDATTPYTEEEHLTAFDAAVKFLKLRSESVIGQIEGSVPSTEELQAAEKEKLIEADFSLSDLGSMSGGPDNEDHGGKDENTSDGNEKFDGNMPPSQMQNGGQPPTPPGGMDMGGSQKQGNGLLLLATAIVFAGAFVIVIIYKRKY